MMSLQAGAAVRDISPRASMFLAGYPHVPRNSVGVHDPLLASALFLSDGEVGLMIIAVDTLFISAGSVSLCRKAIAEGTGLPAENILISATHTHSGPLTTPVLAWKNDPVVPTPDNAYLDVFHTGIIESAVAAQKASEPAQLAITSAAAEGVGCNRLDPNGPFDPEIGLMAIQRRRDHKLTALALIYGMHPTVLHEDSRLVSSDFPNFARQHLREAFPDLTTIYLLAPCGNLSPRYHVQAQTFSEAERLGRRLGEFVVKKLRSIAQNEFRGELSITAATGKSELVPRTFQTVAEAQADLRAAQIQYDKLRRENVSRGLLRTAECMVFGCEEVVTLAAAQVSGELAQWQERYRWAEVQVFRIGDQFLVGLPAEIFVEYGLEIKRRAPNRTFVISLANGESQGYIVTPQASATGGYEAAFALFGPESGARLVGTALALMQKI